MKQDIVSNLFLLKVILRRLFSIQNFTVTIPRMTVGRIHLCNSHSLWAPTLNWCAKAKKKKTHFQILLVKAKRTHPLSLTLSLSLSLSLSILSPISWTTPRISLSRSLSPPFHSPFLRFSSTVHRANNVFDCGRDPCPRVPLPLPLALSSSPSLPHSLPSLYYLSLSRPLSLTFRHNSHSYMKMHGGSSLSHYNLFFGMTGRESERKSYWRKGKRCVSACVWASVSISVCVRACEWLQSVSFCNLLLPLCYCFSVVFLP